MDYDVDDGTVDDYDCGPTETRSTANVDDNDDDEERLYPTRPRHISLTLRPCLASDSDSEGPAIPTVPIRDSDRAKDPRGNCHSDRRSPRCPQRPFTSKARGNGVLQVIEALGRGYRDSASPWIMDIHLLGRYPGVAASSEPDVDVGKTAKDLDSEIV